ncbi:hypothetical protein evm_008220 [Chilo suppressalis]|nr:hypothetical protein evm_008220 [Chilo suppressalis]
MGRISDEKDQPFLLWMGHHPVVVCIHPDDIRAVSNTFIEKHNFYSFGRIWLGNGLVTAPMDIWKRNIKKLGGTFTAGTVGRFQGVFNARAQQLTAILRGKVGSQLFDIYDDISYVTLEAVCQTAFGISGITQSIVSEEYHQAFHQAVQLLVDRGLNPLLYPETVYKLSPARRQMEKCVTVLHNVSETIIHKRKAEMKEIIKQKHMEEKENESSGVKFKSYLDLLLEMSINDPNFTTEQIQAEVDTIIVGGQETIARSMFFILILIGSSKQVQDKLYAEFKEIFGDSLRPVETEDLARMPYCEAVILEALRLYPPFPIIVRYADRDLQLRSCLVPAGAGCAVNIYGAGRSVRIWGPDAHHFRPERWLPTTSPDSPAPDTRAFYAFSTGRRPCIGKQYAMAFSKTILAFCVREFYFTSEVDKLRVKMDLALKPSSGHLLQVYPRKTSGPVANQHL